MDKFTNGIHPSVFYRGDGTNLLHMPQSLTEYVRRWITDGNTYRIYPSIYSREFEKNYYICHYHWWKYTDEIFLSAYFQQEIYKF